MKYIKNSYKKYSKLYLTVFLIISISISLGLLISYSLDNELSYNIYNYFLNYINTYSNNIISIILYPIIVYLIILILSFTIVGVLTPFLCLFIENVSIGLLLGVLLKNKGLKGLLYSNIYFILNKLLYIIFLVYIAINIYKFVINFIKSFKHKKNNINSIYLNIIKKVFLCIIFISIYNLIGIFLIPSILNFFSFLI